MVQAGWLDGSGAKSRPCAFTALVIHALTQPASTSARRLRRSTDKIRFMRASEITTPPLTASSEPLKLVPAPRGMIGTFNDAQTLTIWETCSVVRGSTTAFGGFFSSV